MKNTKLNTFKTAGFSLVEMLVVIAVIGILAAIAVPNIGRINQAAGESKDRRNAQQLSSVCNAAAAAGYDFVEVGAYTTDADLPDLLGDVVTGAKVTDTNSPFYDQYFGVPNLSATELGKADDYLEIKEGLLVYKSNLP